MFYVGKVDCLFFIKKFVKDIIHLVPGHQIFFKEDRAETTAKFRYRFLKLRFHDDKSPLKMVLTTKRSFMRLRQSLIACQITQGMNIFEFF